MADEISNLRYVMRAEDQFTEIFTRYRAGLAENKAALDEFKKSASQNAALNRLIKQLDSVAAAGNAATTATEKAAESHKKAEKQADTRTEAEKRLERAIKKRRQEEEFEALAAEKGFQTAKARRELQKEIAKAQADAAAAQKKSDAAAAAAAKLQEARAKRALLFEREFQAGTNKAHDAAERAGKAAERAGKVEAKNATIKKKTLTVEEEIAALRTKVEAQRARAANKELQDLKAEEIAIKKVEAAERKLLALKKLKDRGFNPDGSRAPPDPLPVSPGSFIERLRIGIAKLRNQFASGKQGFFGFGGAEGREGVRNALSVARSSASIAKSTKESAFSANRVFFTFRRLIGIFAAFQAVRLLTSSFASLVKETLVFNSKIEQAQLGIASLITAVGQVRNAEGEAVNAAQGLALAQNEARRQTRLLRVEGLRTAATFDTLLETFQIGLAPGLAAGLNLDQVRQFTVQISQAASAIGVAQNQLAEEIRSILSGTIQARTTRIAVALGITNEDIRRAKELGVLAEFINEKFSAFKQAGEEALGTFDALVTNTADAFLQLLESGGKEYFEDVKDLLKTIQASIVSTDENGLLQPNPKAVAIVEGITRGLSRAVAEAKRLGESLSIDSLQGLADGLGNIIGFLSEVLGGVIQGVLRGLADIERVASTVFQAISGAASGLFDQEVSLQNIISLLTEAVLLYGAIKITLGLLSGLTAVWGVAVAGVNTLLSATGAILAIIEAPLLLIPVAIGLIAAQFLAAGAALTGVVLVAVYEFRDEIKSLLGNVDLLGLRFGTVAKIIKDVLVAAIEFAGRQLQFFFTSLIRLVRIGLRGAVTFLLQGVNASLGTVLRTLEKVLQAASTVSETARKALFQVRAARQLLEEATASSTSKFTALLKDQISATTSFYANQIATIKRLAADIGGAIANNDSAQTFEGFLGDLKERAKKLLKGGLFGLLFGENENKTPKVVQEAKSFLDFVEQIPPVLGRAREELERNGELMKTLKKETREATLELEKARATVGLSGGIVQQLEKAIEAQQRFKKESEGLNGELQAAEKQLLQTRAGRQQSLIREERLNKSLTQQQIAAAEFAGRAARAAVFDLKEQADLKDRIVLKDLELQRARKEGDQAAVAQFETEKAGLEETLKLRTATLERISASVDEVFRKAGIEEETAAKIRELIQERLTLDGQEITLLDQITAIKKDLVDLESQLQAAALKRIQAIAIAEAARAEQERKRQEIELRAAEAKAQLEDRVGRNFIEPAVRDVLTNTAQLEELTASRELLRLDQERNAAALERLRIAALTAGDLETEAALRAQIAQQNLADNVTLAERDLQIATTTAQLEESVDRLQSPTVAISDGLIEGFKEFGTKALNITENTKQLMLNSLNAFSQTASQLLVDALTPGKEVDIKQAFAQLLGQIGQQIIATVIQIGVTLALMSAIPGFATLMSAQDAIAAATAAKRATQLTSVAQAASATGLHRGGFADQAAGNRPSLAHARARGFSTGGAVAAGRPAGLHPTDTIAAWLAPGEFVIPAKATRAFLPVLEAIRGGSVDPGLLNGLAGAAAVSRASRRQASRGPGFADGGLVSDQARRAAQAQETSRNRRGAGDESAGPGVAVVVPNEESFRRMLASGKRAMRDFLREEGYRSGGPENY